MGSVPFANNWAYLDTELSWLERLLLVAVAQQRKMLKSVARVAKTPADKATSDWWQGLIAVKHRAYDDVAPKSGEQPSLGYQKTLDNRILLSRANKVSLGLPAMQTALGLSLFEKKLVLMALAPEVQARYGRLYHYLQTGANCAAGSLPTVELALRVLCRNETERRRARARLSGHTSLLKRQVLRCVDGAPTFLGSQLQLAPEWVEYLLAETPDPSWPMRFVMAERFSQRCGDRTPWSDIILADPLKQQLQSVISQPQARLLLVGEKGVGKERVAIALATHLKQPLYTLDLAQISPQDWPSCLSELDQAAYPMVLVKSAHWWLGRESDIARTALQQWLTTSSARLIFSVCHRHLVCRYWRQQLTIIDIPMPDAEQRLQLWQQAFPNGVKSMGKVRWTSLAEGLALSQSQIMEIGQRSKTLASEQEIAIDHLQEALQQQGQIWKLR
ncbi:hypothetical protein IQ260_07030 [Leptolyngbya cf. ectocarpi LEGE 11479]|uniref:Winged helix domain-containing protein n=1 Tax=Leptolyngbya cf. ectocarpi LEGE 11479 TaxID=1828722 RepID=A0A928ZSK8_LEPEC|nr:hypothetical protein [Leptolyngbya ectocarpi]MBE9066402.1 hypothetical protein [Leptolyngbya cf. ectocarpi LEGE 11479]